MLSNTDILPLNEYEKIRPLKKQEILELKKIRRLSVGPDITFYFENTQTIWWQIQEMLRIEKGGQEQLGDELCAYNPMIPIKREKGYEISATMMIEIEDADRRKVILNQLYAIDQHVRFEFKNIVITASSIDSTEERNRESDQKTSSVHFLKWHIPADKVPDFLNEDVTLSISHPHYSYKSLLPIFLKQSLKDDFELMN